MSNNDAKFVVKDKSVIYYIIGNMKTKLCRTRNAAGMTKDTATAVCASLNRMLDWVYEHGSVSNVIYEASDNRYLRFKLLELARSLDLRVIEQKVSESLENNEYENSFDAKRNYFTHCMDRFAKDTRIIKIIDSYTYANCVINTEDDNGNNRANLENYDIYTICMLITFARIYNICYLTVMEIGDYMSVTSDSIIGNPAIEEEGLADILHTYVIKNRFPEKLGMMGESFIDKIVFNFMGSQVEKKLMNSSTLMDKFGIIGVDKFSIYLRTTIELLGGLHRISPSNDIGVGGEDKDNYDGDEDPSSRKFYFKKVCKYLQNSLQRILNNNISNVNTKFQVKTENPDSNIEKESFDAYVNDNREMLDYLLEMKKSIYVDALSSIKSETLNVFDSCRIYKHDLNKFFISIYINTRYGISDITDLLSNHEFKMIILHVFDLLKDYPNLRYSLIGQVYMQKNSVNVTLKDFEEDGSICLPPFLCNNVNRSLKILTNYSRNQYRSEIVINGSPSVRFHTIKAELIECMKHIHEIFGADSNEHR